MFELTVTNRLQQCEVVIEKGLQTFTNVGNALLEIRDSRLYKETYDTFEDYCRERWGMVASRARQLIAASEIVSNLQSVTNVTLLPTTESQTRPLSSLEPEQQLEAWAKAIETAPEGKITAAHVQSVVDEIKNDFNYKRDNRRTTPVNIYVPQGMDACQTPAYAIDPLIPHLMQFDIIWEPAAGEHMIVDAFFDVAYKRFKVEASDLIEGNNFFDYEPEKWDCIVTNPPYSIKYQWLERCYQLEKPFALLLPVETLGASTAQQLFEKHGVQVMLLNKRVNFKMPNKGWNASGAQFSTAWFTWGLGLGGQISYGKLQYD